MPRKTFGAVVATDCKSLVCSKTGSGSMSADMNDLCWDGRPKYSTTDHDGTQEKGECKGDANSETCRIIGKIHPNLLATDVDRMSGGGKNKRAGLRVERQPGSEHRAP